MSRVFKEGNLQLDFSKAKMAEKFDNPKRHRVQSWRKVDFVVEQENELWLIEVKEPESETSIKSRSYRKLGRKAKDSFLYLYLMDRITDKKPVKYFVIEALSFDRTLLVSASDRLCETVGVTSPPWSVHPFFQSAVMFNLDTWNNKFPEFPISITSKIPTN